MSQVKQALRAAKTAIENQAWTEAIAAADKVLALDADNYFAQVLRGLALHKQTGSYDAIKAYEAAIRSKREDPLAWQGLITLYEAYGPQYVDDYRHAACNLAQIFVDLDERSKCEGVVNRFLRFVQQHGTQKQRREALDIILPPSPVYALLEGLVPRPADTWVTVATSLEAEEKERINREIGERRTRLGAKIGQVTTDVRREVWRTSPLEDVYRNIIDWSSNDDVRRDYEERWLCRAYDLLTVLPREEKGPKQSQVEDLAKGMVILKHPFHLAWKIVLEWKDGEALADWDAGVLQEYLHFFPEDGLSKVLRGFLQTELSPFLFVPAQDEATNAGGDENSSSHELALSPEDRLLLMTDGVQEASQSILACRLMGEYYLFLEEYESAADICYAAQSLISDEEQKTGLNFHNTIDAINTTLATSLIYFDAPRNHAEAKALFEAVLDTKPTSTSALIGVGLILAEQENFVDAAAFLERAVARDPDNVRIRAEASWCRVLDGSYTQGLAELERCLDDITGADARARQLKALTQYRIGRCIWLLHPSAASRKDRKGAYARFLAAIHADLTCAPAYTSLGVYYADYAKDRKRAQKCFQKAFDLSAAEVEAAERLARSFADQSDWELVEMVAQRVVDSGKARPLPGTKRKGFSWPFAALGVVQLNKQEYPRSIVSFQSALRSAPDDYHSWVGLGESYHNSGRYIAATKAFEQAARVAERMSVGSMETWFTTYMLANVRRELGTYEDAIHGYRQVLADHPREFGVQIALLQTLVAASDHSVASGSFGNAGVYATQALQTAESIAEYRANAFNLWKGVGDACAVLGSIIRAPEDPSVGHVRAILSKDVTKQQYQLLTEVDKMGSDVLGLLDTSSPVSNDVLLYASILAYKRAVHTSADDIHALAVAWYNLGWAEQRVYHHLSRQSRLSMDGEDTLSRLRKKPARHRIAAVRCFKRAIELEAGNSEFWNALGVACSPASAKISQHALIRSLYLNDQNAEVWTNLGALYLQQEDVQLANESFTRAQSTDPDYAPAWLGQGLLALHLGDSKEAQTLFTHASEIADASCLLAHRQYAVSSFDQLRTSPSSDVITLLQPAFALYQLRSQTSDDQMYGHLYALYLERIQSYALATEILERICAAVEQDYEVSESAVSLAHFAHAKADLARVQLATHDYPAATESAQTALQLSSTEADDEASSEFTTAARRACRLSAHLTAGLASYYDGAMDEAIDMFRAALEESDGAADVVCLLAQVLWAKGGTEERSVAREQLLDCVQKHRSHLPSLLGLGAVATLEKDGATLDLVTERLRALRTTGAVTQESARRSVSDLLATSSALRRPDKGQIIDASTLTTIMLFPFRSHGWSQLAAATTDDEPQYPAEMALVTAQRAVPPGGTLSAEALAQSFAATGVVADMQRAVMAAPWVADGWEGLGGISP
ncbi:MAG: Superkiller protein 3 [Thelocarpon superellum]|nr:MAG: Superkiller protein 3 [Thelocarpon superellum]